MAVNTYDQRNIDTMEMVYGRGYLSAGGDPEVLRIFSGINVENSRILDCGCGLGGAAVAMAEVMNAREVVGYDIDEVVISRAQALIDEKNLNEKISLLHGEPGPLPFSEAEFDVVYVTAVSCHLKDLSHFFEDVLRILKPGGWIVGSEWMIRERNQAFQDFDNLLRNRGLNFYFVAALPFENALKKAGFSAVSLVDRTDAFTKFSRIGRDRVTGELKSALQSTLGDSGYNDFLYWTEVRYSGLAHGGLLQQHFRGQKRY